nr:NTP/NDP exchange transporter [Alphaproteobacteria bacterium]
KIYGKWLYALFYVLAELWGSLMLSLLFWQFANHITKTENAKRFYPMYGLVGNFGLILAGFLIKGFSEISKSATAAASADNVSVMITALMVCTAIAILCIMYLYHNINKEISKNPEEFLGSGKKKKKPKLTLIDGFKVIFSSKYLGFVAILVLSYGISINLVEGPWKAKVRELYPDTNQYAYFMGNLTLLTGISSMTMMLIGAHVLPRIRWFSGAILTPLILFISGLGFFVFVVFDDAIHSYIDLVLFDPLWLAVIFGLILNALSKATKYSFFDPTKEMSYIPIDNELKTKGKAAVDIVGARVAKSFGALIPSTLFVLFPDATFSSITPYLMIIFIVISLMWLVDVKFLSVEYEKRLAENKSSGK